MILREGKDQSLGVSAMKIYLFSAETGIYQGEDFADVAMIKGRIELPPCATTIAPPAMGRAEMAVFLAAEERWELRQLPLAGGVKNAALDGSVRIGCRASTAPHESFQEDRS